MWWDGHQTGTFISFTLGDANPKSVLPLWDDDDINKQIKKIKIKTTGDYFNIWINQLPSKCFLIFATLEKIGGQNSDVYGAGHFALNELLLLILSIKTESKDWSRINCIETTEKLEGNCYSSSFPPCTTEKGRYSTEWLPNLTRQIIRH